MKKNNQNFSAPDALTPFLNYKILCVFTHLCFED